MPIASAMPKRKARSVVTVASCQDGCWTRSTAATSTSLSGGRMKMMPSRPTISQSTPQTISEAIIGTRRPNSIMARSVHILLQPLPDLLDRIEVVAVAADALGVARAVDRRLDDLRHAAGPRRQEHDAVGDVDRLLDRMGDEDEGLVLGGRAAGSGPPGTCGGSARRRPRRARRAAARRRRRPARGPGRRAGACRPRARADTCPRSPARPTSAT